MSHVDIYMFPDPSAVRLDHFQILFIPRFCKIDWIFSLYFSAQHRRAIPKVKSTTWWPTWPSTAFRPMASPRLRRFSAHSSTDYGSLDSVWMLTALYLASPRNLHPVMACCGWTLKVGFFPHLFLDVAFGGPWPRSMPASVLPFLPSSLLPTLRIQARSTGARPRPAIRPSSTAWSALPAPTASPSASTPLSLNGTPSWAASLAARLCPCEWHFPQEFVHASFPQSHVSLTLLRQVVCSLRWQPVFL